MFPLPHTCVLPPYLVGIGERFHVRTYAFYPPCSEGSSNASTHTCNSPNHHIGPEVASMYIHIRLSRASEESEIASQYIYICIFLLYVLPKGPKTTPLSPFQGGPNTPSSPAPSRYLGFASSGNSGVNKSLKPRHEMYR